MRGERAGAGNRGAGSTEAGGLGARVSGLVNAPSVTERARETGAAERTRQSRRSTRLDKRPEAAYHAVVNVS